MKNDTLKNILICVAISTGIYVTLVICSELIFKYYWLRSLIFNGTFAFGVIAGIPTVYLWSLREENKKKELEQKQIELDNIDETLKHTKEECLNQRLINILSTEKIKDEHKIYQLQTLLNDWVILYNKDIKNIKLRNIILQILGVIYSFERKINDNTNYVLSTYLRDIISEKAEITYWLFYDSFNYYSKTFNFSYLSFSNLDLSNVNLGAVNLKNTNINYCIFDSSNLIGAQLNNSEINESIFKNTKLDLTNFHESVVFNCTFSGTISQEIIFYDCHLHSCDFLQADFDRHFLEKSDIFNGASLRGCVFDKKYRKTLEENTNIKKLEATIYR